MRIRKKTYKDLEFCLDIDCWPYLLWGQLKEYTVMILELSAPMGFLIYKEDEDVCRLKKICIRENMRRFGLGGEAVRWLTDRYRLVIAELSEEEALGKEGVSPIAGLLVGSGFESNLKGGKYVFIKENRDSD